LREKYVPQLRSLSLRAHNTNIKEISDKTAMSDKATPGREEVMAEAWA
jgi:hypothetical protein